MRETRELTRKVVPVIVGPTGSGKTGVAVEAAHEIFREFGVEAEIISADSRTIFKGMDIGTAKPSKEEREGVRHFGFDLVEPDERFTVKDWKDYAEGKIKEIFGRGNVSLVVGGTGLYVDALVYDYKFMVEGKGYGRERGKCIKNLNGANGKLIQSDINNYPDRQEMGSQYKVFGIFWEREELKKRLEMRADKMFVQELFDETRELVKKFGWENQAMKSNIYKFAWEYVEGRISREEAIKLASTADAQLAKRQMTWFSRNENIVWLPLEKVKPAVIKCIQDEQRK